MKKNFCLVLDIDETIVHTINLPFGNYFLLRPGVINFLEEIEPYWINSSIERKKEIIESLYINYDLKKNFFKQVEEHMKDIISSF